MTRGMGCCTRQGSLLVTCLSYKHEACRSFHGHNLFRDQQPLRRNTVPWFFRAFLLVERTPRLRQVFFFWTRADHHDDDKSLLLRDYHLCPASLREEMKHVRRCTSLDPQSPISSCFSTTTVQNNARLSLQWCVTDTPCLVLQQQIYNRQ